MLCTRVARCRALPLPHFCLWVTCGSGARGFAVQGDGGRRSSIQSAYDTESAMTVCSSRLVSLVLPGRWITALLILKHNGRSLVRLHVEYDQPRADDGRRGENTYNGLPLECGRQIRAAWRHLLLDVENGILPLCPARQDCLHNAAVVESDHGRYP